MSYESTYTFRLSRIHKGRFAPKGLIFVEVMGTDGKKQAKYSGANLINLSMATGEMPKMAAEMIWQKIKEKYNLI